MFKNNHSSFKAHGGTLGERPRNASLTCREHDRRAQSMARQCAGGELMEVLERHP